MLTAKALFPLHFSLLDQEHLWPMNFPQAQRTPKQALLTTSLAIRAKAETVEAEAGETEAAATALAEEEATKMTTLTQALTVNCQR